MGIDALAGAVSKRGVDHDELSQAVTDPAGIEPASGRLGVLHVIAPADVGGAERVVQMLAIGHYRRGHAVHVVAVLETGQRNDNFLEPLRAAEVSATALALPTRAYLQERSALTRLCRELKPDVVHTHGYRPDLVAGPVARRLGIASVTTAHGFTGGGWKNRFFEHLQTRSFRRFDAVVAVSRPLGEQLCAAGVPANCLHVVRNAWATDVDPLDRSAARGVLGVAGQDFRIGFVGRLTREKGADVLLQALARVRDLPVGVSFVGDGRERARLEALANELGLGDRITWHGAVPGASRLLSSFDVLVLSSRSEGTPIVLFEAMAAGVPIIAADVGGIPDVVTDAEAVLVPPESPERLARAIRDAYVHPETARSRVAAARARVTEGFALDPWLTEYEVLYDGIR